MDVNLTIWQYLEPLDLSLKSLKNIVAPPFLHQQRSAALATLWMWPSSMIIFILTLDSRPRGSLSSTLMRSKSKLYFMQINVNLLDVCVPSEVTDYFAARISLLTIYFIRRYVWSISSCRAPLSRRIEVWAFSRDPYSRKTLNTTEASPTLPTLLHPKAGC